MFFKKKNYKIKPNFEGMSEDPELSMIALVSMMTQKREHKAAFVASVICGWVFDEDAGEFLPREKGKRWLSKRISSGEGEAVAQEIDQAVTASMEADREKEMNKLFGLE